MQWLKKIVNKQGSLDDGGGNISGGIFRGEGLIWEDPKEKDMYVRKKNRKQKRKRRGR